MTDGTIGSTRRARRPARSGSASTRCAAGIATAASARERDSANRRLVPASEVERLRGKADDELSARNRFRGSCAASRSKGFLARVELDVTEPARVVAIITREAVEELGLKPGRGAAAIVKSTSVMVER